MLVPLLLATSVWLDVPFVRQEKNGCGAAVAGMVAAYWSRPAPRIDGRPAAASELEQAFRDAGFRAFAFRGEWADLEQHLGQGRPLIVAVEEHFVVVAGVEPGFALVNDPARRKLLRLDRAGFERAWKGRWTLLVLPQSR